MNNIFPLSSFASKIIAIIILICGLLFLFVFLIIYKGDICPKWLDNSKGWLYSLRQIYLQFTFRYFIKIQIFKLSFRRSRFYIIFKELNSNFKREFKEYHRKIKLLPLRFYMRNRDVQFENDSFVKQFTGGKCDHYDIYNIFGLTNKDLFKAVYIRLVTEPGISHKLGNFNISLIGTSFRDLETGIAIIYDIHPNLNMDKYTSFKEFYSSIIIRYCHTGPLQDLDDIYKLEIRMMKN